MAPLPDVLIVGGGLAGSACARALSARGARVTVLSDSGRPGEGWRASAGMLAAQVEGRGDDPILPLAISGRAFYRRHAADLLATTGIDIGLAERGILELAWGESAVDAAKARVARHRQQAYRADWLEPDEVADSWPWLAAADGAFWSPEDGSVDPIKVVEAFRLDAERLGARFVDDAGMSLATERGQLRGVAGRGRMYPAGQVVIAAGAWSGRIEGLPRPLSVEPVRGQMFSVPWPAGAQDVIVYGDRCYLLRRHDELLVGATMEHAGFDVSTDDASLDALRRRASAIYPTLATLRPTRAWSGLRPGTPDGLPIIGAEPRLPGLWYATGHGRNGVLLAGVTGDAIAQLVAGEPDAPDLHAVRPERFWRN